MVNLNLDLFLTPEDVGQGMEIEFLDEGEQISKEDTGFEEDSFSISIKLPNGEKRSWTMNKTSQRMIARKFGLQTSNWIGKKISLTTKTFNVFGKEKLAVLVKSEG